MNLNASKLNRWALKEGADRYFKVASLGHLREKKQNSNNCITNSSFAVVHRPIVRTRTKSCINHCAKRQMDDLQ